MAKTAAPKVKNNGDNEILEKWDADLSSGELKNVTLYFNKNACKITLSTAMSVFHSVGKLASQIQRGKIELAKPELLFDLILQCARIVGIDVPDAEIKISLEDTSGILLTIYRLTHEFCKKELYSEVCRLSLMAVSLCRRIPLLNKDLQQEMLSRTKQLNLVFWRAAAKLKDKTNSVKTLFHCIELMSLQENDLLPLLNFLDNFITVHGKNVQELKLQNIFVQTLLDSIHYKSHRDLSKEEQVATQNLLKQLMKHILNQAIKTGVASMQKELQAISRLKELDLVSNFALESAMQVFNIMETLITCEKNLKPYRNIRQYLTENDAGLNTANLLLEMIAVIVEQKILWMKADVTVVRELQLLLLKVQSVVPANLKLQIAITVVRLTEREVPEEVETEKWVDFRLSGVAAACTAVTELDKVLKNLETDNLESAVFLCNHVTYMAYLFMSKKCYHPTWLLYETLEIFYQCLPSLVSDPKRMYRLLTDVSNSIRNTWCIICDTGGPELEKRIDNVLISVLLVISALSQYQQHLTPDDYTSKMQNTLDIWCKTKQKLIISSVSQNVNKSMLRLWQQNQKKIAKCLAVSSLVEPNWEQLLAKEIMLYSESESYVPLVLRAGEELAHLPVCSQEDLQWANTTLAIAYAKNQQPDAEGPVESQALCSSVLARLEDKKKSAEENVVMMQAYFQLYVSAMKDQRKQSEKLAEIPLMHRAPPLRVGPGGESLAMEAWEEAEELSQLGQELSCRIEARNLYPIVNILTIAVSLDKKGVSKNNPTNISSALNVLKCAGHMLSTMGHYWMSMKVWGVLFSLARAAECPCSQLLALGMLFKKYSLTPDSAEEKWLQENVPHIQQEMKNNQSSKNESILELYNMCRARSLMLSNKFAESAEIVIQVLEKYDGQIPQDLTISAHLLGSQLLISLHPDTPQGQKLREMLLGPQEAASWASHYIKGLVSTRKPAEHSTGLAYQELMIEACLWEASLASMTGFYRNACLVLQGLLQKLQRLMLHTRVAQVLSFLGDLDLMTPDKEQLEQRLFWNQKILSLGAAIEGAKTPKKRTYGTSPTRYVVKKFQLTIYCSDRCMKNVKNAGCVMCKNPLYHMCKAHYASLVEDNQETCLTLCMQVENTWKENCQRLWERTWGIVMNTKEPGSQASNQGWLSMLVGSITILKCRTMMAVAAIQANSKEKPQKALKVLESVIDTLKSVHHENAPLLLSWARAQHKACSMQFKGLGPFSSQLQASFSLNVRRLEVPENIISPRKALTPCQPAAAPQIKRPGRRCKAKPGEFSGEDLPTRPVVPKLVLTEASPESDKISSSNASAKKKTRTAAKTIKSKENIENLASVSSKFTSYKTNIKNYQKPTHKKDPLPIFGVFCDEKSSITAKKKATPTTAPSFKDSTKNSKDGVFSSSDSPILPPKSCNRQKRIESSPESPVPVPKPSATKSRRKVESSLITPAARCSAKVTLESSPESPVPVPKPSATKSRRKVESSLVTPAARCSAKVTLESSPESPVPVPKPSATKSRRKVESSFVTPAARCNAKVIVESSPESPVPVPKPSATKSRRKVESSLVTPAARCSAKVTLESSPESSVPKPSATKSRRKVESSLITPAARRNAKMIDITSITIESSPESSVPVPKPSATKSRKKVESSLVTPAARRNAKIPSASNADKTSVTSESSPESPVVKTCGRKATACRIASSSEESLADAIAMKPDRSRTVQVGRRAKTTQVIGTKNAATLVAKSVPAKSSMLAAKKSKNEVQPTVTEVSILDSDVSVIESSILEEKPSLIVTKQRAHHC